MGRLFKYYISFAALFHLRLNTSLASPSIEPCPSDSILVDGVTCKCNPEFCKKPPCLSTLEIVTTGSDIPGSCCPIYSCEGCDNATLLHGQCPCAKGAILNAENKCKCIDPEKTLKNGECQCDPDFCELPQICNSNFVLVRKESEGCCPKTECVPCPDDSYSTNYNSDALEDKCVCFPCQIHCDPNNQTTKIIQKGKQIPGHCCDMYDCIDNNDQQKTVCVVGDKTYEEGDTWKNWDSQTCICQNGISLCSDNFRACQIDGNMFKHGESWMQDSCTNCTCTNGEPKCIAHFCHFNQATDTDDNDGNGFAAAADDDDYGCQPLNNCNKNCVNGFKLNTKGCEICKCNTPSSQDDILRKYNITKDDLIEILEDRFKSSTTNPSTTEISTIIDHKNSTTFITSTKNCDDQESTVMKGIYAFVAIFVFTIIVGGILIYKNHKKKGSYDPVKLKGADINNYIIRA